jgi:hypothetical protein
MRSRLGAAVRAYTRRHAGGAGTGTKGMTRAYRRRRTGLKALQAAWQRNGTCHCAAQKLRFWRGLTTTACYRVIAAAQQNAFMSINRPNQIGPRPYEKTMDHRMLPAHLRQLATGADGADGGV